MTEEQMTQTPRMSIWKPGLTLFAIWLVTMAVSVFMHRYEFRQLLFADPDDSMRLVQVRDFLAGQSWFDVSQHRANPPAGSPMHWSRLVDLPIAGAILLLSPFVGPHWAEVGAVLSVPALTLAALLAALYWAVRPLMSQAGALLCCAMFASSPGTYIQFAAMRIDHHGWQIVMMALALGGTFHAEPRKGGMIAGLAMAVWLHVSIEGLPLAALTCAAMIFRYIFYGKEWSRVIHYLWTLAIASVILLLVTHGWRASLVSYCDSVSPMYLAPLAAIPVVTTLGHKLYGQDTTLHKLLPIALASGIAAVIFLSSGKQCLAGPFTTLDPLVRRLWYEAVLEGLPIWKQTIQVALMVILPSLLGMIGYLVIVRRENDAHRRVDWLILLILTAGAATLSMLVARTVFVAHLLAMPGISWLTMVLFKRARALNSTVLRIPATAVSLTIFCPVSMIAITSAALPVNEVDSAQQAKAYILIRVNEVAALDGIAPAILFAPVDISPDILLHTRNAIIGTGHHRNAQGLKLVISAFLAPSEEARAIVLSSSATHLLITNTREINRYRLAAPQGLAAQLLEGKTPDWLTPVSVPGLKTLHLYRIDRKDSSRMVGMVEK